MEEEVEVLEETEQKELTKFQKLKKMWKDPKQHAFVVLGFWAIFMVVVVVLIKGMTSPMPSSGPSAPITNEDITFENIKGYEFSYVTDNLEINGMAYENKTLFFLNGFRYYINDNIYKIQNGIVSLEELNIPILKINSIMLNELTKDITPIEGTEYKRYIVPLDKFISLFETDTEQDLTLAINFNIVIDVYEKNNTIEKVVLDLSNYVNLKDGTSVTYILTLYLYNINNVSDFGKSYDEMIGVKE